MHNYSPLRYPGGKARIARFIHLLFQRNNLMDGEYVEPFCGGASVALSLLFAEVVRKVHINDLDPAIHAFWWSVLNKTDELCKLVEDAKLTVDEWREQRSIYRSHDAAPLSLGFATFYLNRTNRSGIVAGGGVIGGLGQTGPWKIDARYNREDLVKRIRQVARYRTRITLTNLDALELLGGLASCAGSRTLVYLDPPYYKNGKLLYKDHYRDQDHAQLAGEVAKLAVPWVVSYDKHQAIIDCYSKYRRLNYGLQYSAAERIEGQEVMFFSDGLFVPKDVLPLEVTRHQLLGQQHLFDLPKAPPVEVAHPCG